jgi:hypothetical protein
MTTTLINEPQKLVTILKSGQGPAGGGPSIVIGTTTGTAFDGGSGQALATSVTAINAALPNKADLVSGLVPAGQLPGFVDDVLEFANLAAFPVTGEAGKLYVAANTNLVYRWSGSVYVVTSTALAIGTTTGTAADGGIVANLSAHAVLANAENAWQYDDLVQVAGGVDAWTDPDENAHGRGSFVITASEASAQQSPASLVLDGALGASIVCGAHFVRAETDGYVVGTPLAFRNALGLGTMATQPANGPIVLSGAASKLTLPRLTTAERTAQASKANGDTFIDDTSSQVYLRKAGVDTPVMAGENIADYLRYLDHARCIREVNSVALTSYFNTVLTGTGTSAISGFSRRVSTGTTANSTARMVWNGGIINNAGVAVHSVPNVDGRIIPFGRPIFIIFRLQWQNWKGANVNSAMTGTGGGVFARCYFGCVGSGSNYTLGVRGIGLHINDQREVRLAAHNGTSLTESASSLSTCPNSTAAAIAHEYTIFSDGAGNVSLFQNGSLLGSITGGPTANTTSNQCGISFEVGNGTDTVTTDLHIESFSYGIL